MPMPGRASMKARALEASRLPTATTEPEEKAGTSAANLPAIFPAPRIPQRSGGASWGLGDDVGGVGGDAGGDQGLDELGRERGQEFGGAGAGWCVVACHEPKGMRAAGRLGWKARVAELVDAPDLGSGAFGCEGSSPFSRTNRGHTSTR